jgi:hypothetical protein
MRSSAPPTDPLGYIRKATYRTPVYEPASAQVSGGTSVKPPSGPGSSGSPSSSPAPAPAPAHAPGSHSHSHGHNHAHAHAHNHAHAHAHTHLHPPFGFPEGFATYEKQVAMANDAIYAGQASPHEAPLRLVPDPEGLLLGYPGHCSVLGSIPDCSVPQLPPPRHQYPYGALAWQGTEMTLADGNPTDIKNVGAYLTPQEAEPEAWVPGFGAQAPHGTYYPGPRNGGGFGGFGACGMGCATR